MYSFRGFTEKGNQALNNAILGAQKMGHTYIGSEHVMSGLLSVGDSAACQLLAKYNVSESDYNNTIAESIGVGVATSLEPSDFTPRVKRILEQSVLLARKLGHSYVGCEHLLAALLQESDSVACQILQHLGVDLGALSRDLSKALQNPSGGSSREGDSPKKGGAAGEDPVEKYGKDLTKLAKDGLLDPVIGREKEIERVIQILSRRTKNNPCLIGEPGVGKTAMAEGLAQKIIEGEVPETIKGKRVVTLDLTGMVAGTKYRGEFEERLKNAIDELIAAKDTILFIDEIHTIMGAGAAEGSVDAANILKPSLARGEIQLIGATTINEYRKYIEKDAALERRFQPVMIDEPTKEDSVLILKGLRDKYEAHHKIKISDEAILAAVDLSSRYIGDRFLPDKAIDLIDEAASRVRLKNKTAPKDVQELENRLKQVAVEKQAAIDTQDFENAARLRDEEKDLQTRLDSEKKAWQENSTDKQESVTAEDIANVVSLWTKVPVTQLTQTESERLLGMEDILRRRVIGQDDAVIAVSKAIRRGRVGLKDPKRPIGSFIFLGPTGVGKTELTKALAEAMFGDENAMIRLDMSEYMEKHTVSKLIGSPPGYVGYDEGGQLTEKIRRSPYSVVLFDEIEKAHPDVFNMLLQILEDGILTDSQGRRVDFKNSVIIMTSNVGAGKITKPRTSLGFGGSDDDQKDVKDLVMAELKQTFKPEFLNRVDDIIVFNKLSQENIEMIASNMLQLVGKRMEDIGIATAFDSSVVAELAKEGFDPVYGARPLRRAIVNKIEDMLSEAILQGNIAKGDSVTVVYDGAYTYTKEAKQ